MKLKDKCLCLWFCLSLYLMLLLLLFGRLFWKLKKLWEVNEVKGQMLMPLVLLVTVLSFNFPATEGSDNFPHNFFNFQIIF